MPTTEVHQFSYGLWNTAAAFLFAFGGSWLAIRATIKARHADRSARRASWLIIAAVVLGSAIWLMHFIAMLGFDVPASPVRYDAALTTASALVAVAVVSIGLFVVGTGRRSVFKLLLGGLFTGSGVAAMHYTGMAALRLSGVIRYDTTLVVASVLIAIVAATVAFWFTLNLNGRAAVVFASFVMAIAVCAMHYTGMAAVHVHLTSETHTVSGLDPLLLLTPIVVAALLGLVIVALQAMGSDSADSSTVDDRPRPAANHQAPARSVVPAARAARSSEPVAPRPHPVSLADFTAMQKNDNSHN